jgi:hypothetical protein
VAEQLAQEDTVEGMQPIRIVRLRPLERLRPHRLDAKLACQRQPVLGECLADRLALTCQRNIVGFTSADDERGQDHDERGSSQHRDRRRGERSCLRLRTSVQSYPAGYAACRDPVDPLRKCGFTFEYPGKDVRKFAGAVSVSLTDRRFCF